jgi:prolyl 4-hydroxylase
MTTEFNADWKAWIKTNIDNGQDKHGLFKILLDEGFAYQTICEEMQFEPTAKTEFNAAWKNWIKTNVDDGQDRDGLFKILLDEGFSYQAIHQEMQFEPTLNADELVNPLKAKEEKYNAGEDVNLGQRFIPNSKRLDSDVLQLFTLENFLNKQECEHIITAIKSALRPSELSSHEPDNAFRTSKTCDMGSLDDALIKDIDLRICRLLGIDESYSEAIQGQYYEVGQEFKPHTDYFEEHEMASHGAVMGQRTFTVMIYLNTVQEGGVTRFPKVDKDYQPQQGLAVIWSSLDASGLPNINSMHHGQPVLKGYKAIITKWFRSNSRLPVPPPMDARKTNDYIPNYTKMGFSKTRLPDPLFKKIQAFYTANLASGQSETVPGDFIFNSDKATKQSSLLVNLNAELREEIHEVLKILMEQWCGKALIPTFVYGVRVYQRGAVLKCHQDRLETHIISAIINIDQQIDKDWPLVIDDNYYRRHEVILKPGEVIFYEGGRLSHGRPYPLEGDSFANVFCHFKPADYVPRVVTQET